MGSIHIISPLDIGAPICYTNSRVIVDILISLISLLCMTLLALCLAELSSKVVAFLLNSPTQSSHQKSSLSTTHPPSLCPKKYAMYSTQQYIHTKEQFFGLFCDPVVDLTQDVWANVEYTGVRSSLRSSPDGDFLAPDDVWSPLSGWELRYLS